MSLRTHGPPAPFAASSVILFSRILVFMASIGMAGSDAAAGAERADLVIRGGIVVAMDTARRVIDGGSVAIVGDKIAAIGTVDEIAARYDAARTIDARGRIVMPGLVNAHGHAAMTLLRGMADDKALMDWLQNYIFPAEAKMVDEAFVRAGTRLALLEMLLGGTTTYVDMYYFEFAVAEETARAGMRGVIGQAMLDFPAPDFKTWDASLAGTEAFLKQWQNHPLITPAVAPHAPYTVSPEHLQAAAKLAADYRVPIIIHVSETKAELATMQERYKATPIEHLDRLGVLKENVIAKHVVWATDAELLTLRKHGVGVVHCPQSNMKLASGIAPVPKMLELKIPVALGTDGAASNNDLDMWEEIDTVAKLHKVATLDPTVVSAREAVAMGTIEGARAIHMADQIGSLEVGKKADVILVGLDAAHEVPMYDVYSHLAYTVKASDVQTVVVGGKVVVEDRRPQTLDAAAIIAEARTYRDKVRAAIGK
ncbi:MAG: amidohydrolase [Planctomycetia bacterium]|nr:amidohydrolase [Planctomycetia bacterium]